ncbi:F-box/kelch-repeat protein At3g06240-like [Lotus japonicus]|uniref:F-box/kelch-repeat protein At3g06240-like n=1 Tax=Lotus japonicus TaxID=34305 RepID=UPI00258936AD|nr:F-box/kelch-repeat protein At3g06240-like [Lotus japonicus]
MENSTLPEELLVEILLRLPVKSVVRLKCVCKLWLSLIFDPQFAKSHFDLAAKPTHHVLTSFNNGSQITSLSFEGSLTDVSDKFPPAPCKLDVPLPSYGPHALRPVVCCRGFVLLANEYGRDVTVWNPTTGTHRKLPVTYDDRTLVGFGYDKSTDDYLLVLIRQYYCKQCVRRPKIMNSHVPHPQIQVFSLKANAPSLISGFKFDFKYEPPNTEGLFLNQSIHWLVESNATNIPLIVAFDLIDRSLTEIPLSIDCVELWHCKDHCYLKVLGGCLSLHYLGFQYEGGDGIRDQIWVMKEYKVPSSWIKCFVLQGNISDRKNHSWPICLSRDGALLASRRDGRIMKLNDNGEVLKQHRDDGLKNNHFPHHHMYRESFLPLP